MSAGPYHYLRTEGAGMGWLGQTVRVDNDTFWGLAMAGRIKRNPIREIVEKVRRERGAAVVNQFISERHPGADAATISFDAT